MAESSLIKKLLITKGQTIAIINPPDHYLEKLVPMPEYVEVLDHLKDRLDFIQVFLKSKSEVENQVPAILKALKPGGLLWISYPKGGSNIKTDLNRDILWKAMEKYLYAGVSLISVDNVWSSMRFRHSSEVGK